MADVALSTQFWKVQQHCPGAPTPLVFYAFAEAAKEFLYRSEAWRYDVPTLLDYDIADTFPNLAAAIPANTWVVRPVALKWAEDGALIPFVTRAKLDEAAPLWETETADRPTNWTITGPRQYRIYPRSSIDTPTAIRARVALSIKVPESTTIPEELMHEWDEAFVAGALARLFGMSGKDWTDPRRAGGEKAIFERFVSVARGRTDADYARPTRTVAYGGL